MSRDDSIFNKLKAAIYDSDKSHARKPKPIILPPKKAVRPGKAASPKPIPVTKLNPFALACNAAFEWIDKHRIDPNDILDAEPEWDARIPDIRHAPTDSFDVDLPMSDVSYRLRPAGIGIRIHLRFPTGFFPTLPPDTQIETLSDDVPVNQIYQAAQISLGKLSEDSSIPAKQLEFVLGRPMRLKRLEAVCAAMNIRMAYLIERPFALRVTTTRLKFLEPREDAPEKSELAAWPGTDIAAQLSDPKFIRTRALSPESFGLIEAEASYLAAGESVTVAELNGAISRLGMCVSISMLDHRLGWLATTGALNSESFAALIAVGPDLHERDFTGIPAPEHLTLRELGESLERIGVRHRFILRWEDSPVAQVFDQAIALPTRDQLENISLGRITIVPAPVAAHMTRKPASVTATAFEPLVASATTDATSLYVSAPEDIQPQKRGRPPKTKAPMPQKTAAEAPRPDPRTTPVVEVDLEREMEVTRLVNEANRALMARTRQAEWKARDERAALRLERRRLELEEKEAARKLQEQIRADRERVRALKKEAALAEQEKRRAKHERERGKLSRSDTPEGALLRARDRNAELKTLQPEGWPIAKVEPLSIAEILMRILPVDDWTKTNEFRASQQSITRFNQRFPDCQISYLLEFPAYKKVRALRMEMKGLSLTTIMRLSQRDDEDCRTRLQEGHGEKINFWSYSLERVEDVIRILGGTLSFVLRRTGQAPVRFSSFRDEPSYLMRFRTGKSRPDPDDITVLHLPRGLSVGNILGPAANTRFREVLAGRTDDNAIGVGEALRACGYRMCLWFRTEDGDCVIRYEDALAAVRIEREPIRMPAEDEDRPMIFSKWLAIPVHGWHQTYSFYKIRASQGEASDSDTD